MQVCESNGFNLRRTLRVVFYQLTSKADLQMVKWGSIDRLKASSKAEELYQAQIEDNM